MSLGRTTRPEELRDFGLLAQLCHRQGRIAILASHSHVCPRPQKQLDGFEATPLRREEEHAISVPVVGLHARACLKQDAKCRGAAFERG